MPANEIRIIGGKWKRRKLRFHPAPGLRPSLGRVRETMANWLRPDLGGAHCLDLFAGSGALGLEALSQGAAFTTFVEQNRRQAEALRQQLASLNAQADVQVCRAEAFLARQAARAQPTWDIVFLDPPFASNLLQVCLADLQTNPSLKAGGLVYYECQRQTHLNLEHWSQLKQATAGDTQFGLLARLT